jgi:hypothetical protein
VRYRLSKRSHKEHLSAFRTNLIIAGDQLTHQGANNSASSANTGAADAKHSAATAGKLTHNKENRRGFRIEGEAVASRKDSVTLW